MDFKLPTYEEDYVMKKLSVKSVVAIGIGAALFFVLGKVAIPSPVPNTNISLQYAIEAVFATLFGPIAGVVIGFIGHTLIDATSYGPWWSWIIASAFAGLVIRVRRSGDWSFDHEDERGGRD